MRIKIECEAYKLDFNMGSNINQFYDHWKFIGEKLWEASNKGGLSIHTPIAPEGNEFNA